MGVERVWVVTESSAGVPAPSGLELLAAARSIARVVEAVHWGADAHEVAPELGRHGAARVLTAGELGPYLPGAPVAAAVAARIQAGDRPDAVFFTTTHDQRDIAGRLSARLDLSLLTNAVGVHDDDGLVAGNAALGGTALVQTRITGPPPHLIAFRPKAFTAEPAGATAATMPEVVELPVPDAGAAGRATVVGRHAERHRGVSLDDAAVVVAGGRGVGDASGFALVERLARCLGGAPAATRASVDAGWAPWSWLVGQTGRTVKPKVYVACGISGAGHHVVGMKGAEHVVAVNNDRYAPIFAIADLGVVGDVAKVLPRLVEALEARNSRGGQQ